MRKLNLRYLYTAVAAAALTAAAIAIPAWATSGGASGAHREAGTRAAPLPPPPGGAGFSMRAAAPSAAEMRQNRAKLDEFASCLKDHGLDLPSPGSSGRPPSPPSSSEMRKITKECGTPPAPPAVLPPLDRKHVDAARKAMAKGNCPPLPLPPPRSSK